MKLKQVIEIASKGYPEGKVLEAFNEADPARPKPVGDHLAEFISSEIALEHCEDEEIDDARDPDERAIHQLLDAIEALQRAKGELEDVIDTLITEQEKFGGVNGRGDGGRT